MFYAHYPLKVRFTLSRGSPVFFTHLESGRGKNGLQGDPCGVQRASRADGVDCEDFVGIHLEVSSPEKVSDGLQTVQVARLNVIPWVSDFIDDLSSFDPDKPHSLEEYQTRFTRREAIPGNL